MPILFLFLLAGTAQAQSDRDTANRIARLEQELQRLQRQLPAARGPGGAQAPGVEPAQDSASDVTVRLLALERIVEQLTGQIEETRFAAQRTARQVQVLQDDLSLRLASIEQSLGLINGAVPGAAQTTGQVSAPAPAPISQPAAPGAGRVIDGSAEEMRRVPTNLGPDVPLSQPVTAQPSARPTPLAPSPAPAAAAAPSAGAAEGLAPDGAFIIRTDAAGRPLPPDPNAPQAPAPVAPPPQQAVPRAAPGPGPVTSSQVASAPAGLIALPDGTPKQQYEFAFEFLKRQDYPKAEATLRDFLKRHPKDPLAGNAQYWLGETYYVRGDFQQAAVEFMAGYQNYPKTNKGPDNLLKLGMSMAKLNQSQGACTALGRIGKDYPDAPDPVLKSAQAERAKIKCK